MNFVKKGIILSNKTEGRGNMKQVVSFLTILLFSLTITNLVNAEDPAINHPNLEEAIKYQMGVDSKVVISEEDLLELHLLDASWWGIPDLSGFGKSINLTSLYIEGNNLSNIEEVGHLDQLQYLSMADNNITDISPLEGFRNLHSLDLSFNQLSDINALDSITFSGNEGGLSLANNKISSLFPLLTTVFPENPQSFYIDVSNNLLTSFNGLQHAEGVTEISAENNRISDVNDLAKLDNLDYIDVTNNNISSLNGISDKPLSVIKMSNNQLTTLDGLTINSDKSYYYEFQNNNIENISGLNNITQGYIDLQNNKISDISALKDVKKGTVNLKGNPLAGDAMEIIYTLKQRGVEVTYDSIEIPGMDEMRLSGSSRYDTAVKISQEGWTSSETVVLARGDSFPDALAGVSLAYKKNAPILLTSQNTLVAETKKEINRLKAKQVIILGGTAAISQNVEEELRSNGFTVKRIAGSGRFDTARKIALEIGGSPNTAVIAYGYNFPDALSAASYAAQKGYPILLTDQKQLPQPTKEYVENIQNTIVVGGEGVVGKEVLTQLNNPTRIGGSSRFDTAAKMITTLGMSTEEIYIGNGYGYADALTGSVLAAKRNSPLLLVEKDKLPKETASIFTNNSVKDFTVLGGDVVVNDEVVFELTQLIK